MRTPRRNGDSRSSQQTRRDDARSIHAGSVRPAQEYCRYCSAAASRRELGIAGNKISQINALTGYDAILTWLEAVSMVRAAFEGDGASFPSTRQRFGS